MTTRNQVYAALFALTAGLTVAGGGPFVTRSRKFKHFSKVAADQQPAFFQTEHTERPAERTNMPAKRTWSTPPGRSTWRATRPTRRTCPPSG
jgi:hypothetical protein